MTGPFVFSEIASGRSTSWCVHTSNQAHNERIMQNDIRPAVRVDGNNPLHHLWNNHGTWWCHLTLHYADGTAERKRFSLKTNDPGKACRRRDAILSALSARTGSPG